jgi:hypothetical protein
MKQPPVKQISVMVIYSYDQQGNIKYDYEEMGQHFAFQLSLLENEIIDIKIKNTGDPLIEEDED